MPECFYHNESQDRAVQLVQGEEVQFRHDQEGTEDRPGHDDVQLELFDAVSGMKLL